ncbi:hypothetical protein [Loktanella atrilutea]|uniref:hypothetical protein n=1 Tax=Loktanella atrilutea TaxID=366533 RepID=UPI000932D1E1|nr:hypothetical protein [Loktanella atrilutea]
MPVYNGVGAYWMPRWLRSILTAWFLWDFTEAAAEAHDLAYYLRDQPRAVIDRIFLDRMLLQATTARTRAKACLIYIMVRAFGGQSYDGKRNKKGDLDALFGL